jgi:hypothetical protein
VSVSTSVLIRTFFFLIYIVGWESKLGSLDTSATKWPIVSAPGDYDDGEFGGMKIGRGNRSSRRKPTLCQKEAQNESISAKRTYTIPAI